MAGSPSAASTWPPSNTPLTTIAVPTESAILFMSGSAKISAPASKVFDKILHVGDYASWNTFTPRADIVSPSPSSDNVLQLGSRFNLYAVLVPGKGASQNPMRVTDLSTPENPSSYVPAAELQRNASFTGDLSRVYRAAWCLDGGLVSKGLKAERFCEVIVLGDEECEVRSWELQGGVLARVVKFMYEGTLQERFGDWCRDLKAVCEKEHGGATAV